MLVLIALLLAARAPEWPQWRGPASDGVVADDPKLPERWSQTENAVWKAEVPGSGWSSPIVAGNRVFLTSVVNTGSAEVPKKGLYSGGNREKPPTTEHRWMVYAFDFGSGKKVWEREVLRGVPATARHLKNTYASETPVTDGERLYAYFGNAGLFCFTLDGKPVWERKWTPHETRYGWGTAASPVLHQNRLYIVADNEQESAFEALDKATGRTIWRVNRDEKSNWATPFVWTNDRRTEIVVPGTKRTRSYDLDGKVIWEIAPNSSIVIPTPFAKNGLLYLTSGYVGDQTRPVYVIRPGASGDISLASGEKSNQFVVWSYPQAGPYNPSPLVYGDYYYTLLDRGFFTCHDARTGREVYPRQRIDPAAAAFTASPWAYNGKIFALSEDGDTYVIQAGPEFKVIGKNSLDEMSMATPAIAKGSLLIRTAGKLYRIGKR